MPEIQENPDLTNERWGLTVTWLINEWFDPETVDTIFEMNVDNRVEELIVGANLESEKDHWIDWKDDELHEQALKILAKWWTMKDVEKLVFEVKSIN